MSVDIVNAHMKYASPVNALVVAFILAIGMMAGCYGEYDPNALKLDSPFGKGVVEMVETLRKDGIDALEDNMLEQATPGLSTAELSLLRNGLSRLVEAESAKLVTLDAFGGQVLRAGFEVVPAEGEPAVRVYLLLVEVDQKPRWLKPN